jgi:transposase
MNNTNDVIIEDVGDVTEDDNKGKEILKSSRHSINYANIGKRNMLDLFVSDMRDAVWTMVDYLWENRIEWCTIDKKRGKIIHVLDVKNNKFDVPNFISTTEFNFGDLSARAIKRATSQALGIVSSSTKKRKKQYYKLAEKMRSGSDPKSYKRLQSKIDSNPLTKPNRQTKTFDINLDSNCVKYIAKNQTKVSGFDGWLVLKSIGKKYGEIILPINDTKHTNKLQERNFERKTSWLINNNEVKSIWSKRVKPTEGTKILGADQGLTTCLTLSDTQITKPNEHGYDLKSIIDILCRKKPGSNAYKATQEHRKNYINWSIKQLNLTNVKEFRLEELRNVRKGKKSSALLAHWTYTEINNQIFNLCGELGVPVTEQGSQYRSQRCNCCGWVQKLNRCRKEFICKSCGYSHDADVNGAMNHAVDLYPLPFNFWRMQLNRKGFFWTSEGIYDTYGSEITVPIYENV